MCCKVAELRLVTALPAQELLASQMLQRLVKSVPAKITPDSLGFINGFLEGMSAHQLTIGAEMNDMLAVATLRSGRPHKSYCSLFTTQCPCVPSQLTTQRYCNCHPYFSPQ